MTLHDLSPENYYEDERMAIRLEMNEFMNKKDDISISKCYSLVSKL